MPNYQQKYEAIVRKMATVRESYNEATDAEKLDHSVRMAELKNQLLALTRTRYPAVNTRLEVTPLKSTGQ